MREVLSGIICIDNFKGRGNKKTEEKLSTLENDIRKIKELVINLDNGPQMKSTRTQFIKRMIAFADVTGLRIRLVYYPPYHR